MTITNEVFNGGRILKRIKETNLNSFHSFKKYLIKTYQIRVLIKAFTKCSIVQNRTVLYSIVLYCTALYRKGHITKNCTLNLCQRNTIN